MTSPEILEDHRTRPIRELNDAFRRSFVGGTVLVTACVAALADKPKKALLAAVRSFEAFTADNDPHGERDLGEVVLGGERWIWKIDYFDRDHENHSPDPADRAVTARVLTLMRADEY